MSINIINAFKKVEDLVKHYILQDKTTADALPVLHLFDVLKPGKIDYSIVKQGDELE